MNILTDTELLKNSQSEQEITKEPRREHVEIEFRTHVQKSHIHRIVPRVPDYFEFLPIGYMTLDEKGAVKTANQAAAEMLGVEKSLLINADFIDFVHRKDQKFFG